MELIDANKLLEHLYNKQTEQCDVALEIAKFPTVDAVEVVHGKLDNERVVEAIEQLSDIRAQYDYYNPDEIRKCHALTFAIVMLNDVLGERRNGDEKY